jgi:hypothetical protein
MYNIQKLKIKALSGKAHQLSIQKFSKLIISVLKYSQNCHHSRTPNCKIINANNTYDVPTPNFVHRKDTYSKLQPFPLTFAIYVCLSRYFLR